MDTHGSIRSIHGGPRRAEIIHCVTPVSVNRLLKAKAAYTARRVPLHLITSLLHCEVAPRPGDLLLARVDRLGRHQWLELGNGRRAPLFEGDEIVLCYGHHSGSYSNHAKTDLCQLVSAGGIASLPGCAGDADATCITPLGLLGGSGNGAVNIADWALPESVLAGSTPLTIGVVGATVNSGAAMTAAGLIRGLVNSGLKVGAAKFTGNGSGEDAWLMSDAGAERVLDFIDAGLASSCHASPRQLERSMLTLMAYLQGDDVDAIVVDVASDLGRDDAITLLASPLLRHLVNGLVFTARNAQDAVRGVSWLREHSLPVHAISGRLAEKYADPHESNAVAGLPLMNFDDLLRPDIARRLVSGSDATSGSPVVS